MSIKRSERQARKMEVRMKNRGIEDNEDEEAECEAISLMKAEKQHELLFVK